MDDSAPGASSPAILYLPDVLGSARSKLLRHRAFVLLFAAQLVSLLGSGATTIGLALFAYRLAGATEATALVGNALMLRILAFLLFSQPAGVVADRWPRKRILVAADLGRAAILGLLPLASTIWHVYALVFVLNALTAFFTPTFEATIPAIVAEEDLVTALGLSRIATDVEALAAPAVAAAIVAGVGVDGVFWFDGATYLASAVLVLFAALPGPGERATPRSWRGFAGDLSLGTRIVLREPSLRQAILMSFAEATAGAGAIVVTVALVRNVLGRGETAVSLVMAAVGAGSALTALALGRVTGRYERAHSGPRELHRARHVWGRRALLTGGLCMAAALLPIASAPPLVVVAALWALLGAGQALVAIPGSTLLAEHTTPDERGRAYAAHFALTHACWLVTYPALGHAAVAWGATRTLTAAGAVCLGVTLLAALARTGDPRHSHE